MLNYFVKECNYRLFLITFFDYFLNSSINNCFVQIVKIERNCTTKSQNLSSNTAIHTLLYKHNAIGNVGPL